MNLKLLILFYFTYFLSINSYAQDKVAVVNQSEEMELIGTSIFYFEDTSAVLSFEQIQSEKYQKQFQDYQQDIFTNDASHSMIWIKFSIQNQTNQDIWIDFGGTFTLQQLYFYAPNKEQEYNLPVKLGALYPNQKKQFPSINYSIKAAQENENQVKTFYAQINPKVPQTIPLQVGTTLAFFRKTPNNRAIFLLLFWLSS